MSDGSETPSEIDESADAEAEATNRPKGGPSQQESREAVSEQRADAASAFVSRDSEGNLQSVDEPVPGQGEATFIPMTYGDAEEYMGDAGEMAMLTADTVAEVLRNHVIEPDFEAYAQEQFGRRPSRDHALTGYVVEKEMRPFVPQVYLMTLLRISGLDAGVDMQDDGSAMIDFETDESGNLTASQAVEEMQE